MKNKYILSACIGCLLISDTFASDLKEAVSNLEVKIAKLSKSLSLDDIQQILQEANSVRKRAESSNISEEEETEILELEEDCMFLNVAKQYLEDPNKETAEMLQEWGEGKPHLQPIRHPAKVENGGKVEP